MGFCSSVVRDLFEDGFGVYFKTGALPEENTKQTKMEVKAWQSQNSAFVKKYVLFGCFVRKG